MANKKFRVCMLAAAAWMSLAAVAPRAAWAAGPALEFRTVAGAQGVPLNVVTTGDRAGRPVVFVHGIGQSYVAFENQLRSSLQQNLFLVAFDLRGHGNSGKPWNSDAYSDRAIWAADLDSVIRGLELREHPGSERIGDGAIEKENSLREDLLHLRSEL